MRGVRKGLTKPILIAAIFASGALALQARTPPLDIAAWVETGKEAVGGWFARVDVRATPPFGITITLPPFDIPLRGSQFEDGAGEIRHVTPEPPHEIVPEKPSTPLDMQYAEDSIPPAVDLTPRNERFSSPLYPAAFEVAQRERMQNEQVAQRLKATLGPDLYANFSLFVYVSKAAEGPWAQRMFVFAKEGRGTMKRLALLYKWAVSTGRETEEEATNGVRMSTATPAGIYQLDPDRFYRRYRSMQWGSEMPNSMFFNWMKDGYPTGLAIHGVEDPKEIAALGERASAGCVHLAPETSRVLFSLIRSKYRGMVPRFAYDAKTMTIANDGSLLRDASGGLRMQEGYRVVVLIDDFGGAGRFAEQQVDSPGGAG